jgi:cell division transport system permease protein
MLDKLEFLFGEAFTALRRNAWMTFAAITTVAISLFLLGGMTYSYLMVRNYAETLPGKFTVRVHLKQGTDTAAIKKTAESIRLLEGVKEVNWIPRDKAWAKKKTEDPELTAGIDNPYPDAFKVTLSSLNNSDGIADAIHRLPSVQPGSEGVVYFKDEQRFIDQGLQLMRWLGSSVGGLLFVTAGILIYNAIRLAIHARRIELRIMSLVGASRLTVRIPFLIEGAIQGAAGGLLATLIIWACKIRLDTYLASLQGSLLGKTQSFPLGTILLILSAAGASYGLLCSNLALRKPVGDK